MTRSAGPSILELNSARISGSAGLEDREQECEESADDSTDRSNDEEQYPATHDAEEEIEQKAHTLSAGNKSGEHCDSEPQDCANGVDIIHR